MAKGSGTRSKKAKGSPSGSEDLGHAPAAASSPEKLKEAQGEPSGLSDACSALVPLAPVFVTQEAMASAMGGLEQRLTTLITSSLSREKRTRSPSPSEESLDLGHASSEEVDLPSGDLAEGQLEVVDSEDSTLGEPFSASQSEKLWVQSLTEMVRSAFKLPLSEPASSAVSSLGSLKAPQANYSFPVHPLLEGLIYKDWEHPDRYFLPPKKFSVLYPMEEQFTKKWGIPKVDAAVSCVNKSLTCPVDNVLVFKDPTDKRLETLLKTSFASARGITQPAIAAIGICQALKDQFKGVLKELPAQQAQNLAEFPRALCFAIDAIKDSIQQSSRLTLSLVHMRRLLWLKNWSAEAPCKKLLAGFPFHGERLFGEDLDAYIQKISSGKSTLLPVKKRFRGPPSFKRSSSPIPSTSGTRQFRRPPGRFNAGGKPQGQPQASKKPWNRKPQAKPATKSAL